MSALQTAIAGLQAAETALVQAVKSYNGSIASKANESLRKARVAGSNTAKSAGSLRNRIENDGQSLVLDWQNDVGLVNGEARPLSEIVTFSRSSGGGRFGPDGKYEWIPADRTNLFKRSNEFTHADWSNTGAVVTADGAGPFGVAYLMKEAATDSGHRVFQSVLVGLGEYTMSVYAKAAGRSWLRLDGPSAYGLSGAAYYNLTSGGLGSVGPGTKASITPVGDDWYRCDFTRTATATGAASFNISVTSADGVSSHIGDGASGVRLGGAQVEPGSKATAYIPTSESSVSIANRIPRIDYDPLTGKCRGLLIEEQRTNLIPNSSAFSGNNGSGLPMVMSPGPTLLNLPFTRVARQDLGIRYMWWSIASYGVSRGVVSFFAAPDAGDFVAVRLQANYPRRADIRVNIRTGTILGMQAHGGAGTPSVTITPVGHGVMRVSLACDMGDQLINSIGLAPTSREIDVDGSDIALSSAYFAGIQFEQGAFPTSYIPTNGSAVTRARDHAIVPTISEWHNPAEWALLADVASSQSVGVGGAWSVAASLLSSGTNYADHYMVRRTSNINAYFGSGGTSSDLVTAMNTSAYRAALSVAAGANRFSANGAAAVSSNTPASPASNLSQLLIGASLPTTQTRMNGHIARIEYFPRAFTAAQLQELTK